jgi:hypothetical protein
MGFLGRHRGAKRVCRLRKRPEMSHGPLISKQLGEPLYWDPPREKWASSLPPWPRRFVGAVVAERVTRVTDYHLNPAPAVENRATSALARPIRRAFT